MSRPATVRYGASYPPYATQLIVGRHHTVADEPVDLTAEGDAAQEATSVLQRLAAAK